MFYLLLFVLLLFTAATAAGKLRWKFSTAALHNSLEGGRTAPASTRYDPKELDPLPAPVQRYFRKVLQEGQPIITAAVIEQSGTFNMGKTIERWSTFTARQHVLTSRPGFVWNARISMLPGIPVFVHDAYTAGEGLLRAALLGLINVTENRGGRQMNEGELLRYLAEAPWYPTALLPSQGIAWETVNDSSARATLRDGDTTVSMLFHFNEDDLIQSVRAEARGREVQGKFVPTPWEGTMSGYDWRQGMLVPTEGEVAWILPAGRKPYWRGRLLGFRYEFAA